MIMKMMKIVIIMMAMFRKILTVIMLKTVIQRVGVIQDEDKKQL